MMRRALLALLGVTFLALASGCATKTAEDSTIPWSRPASWEGGVPGMGGMGGR
jgi:ABC-type glycerol-3-phosphate transport system substrate-binding protein